MFRDHFFKSTTILLLILLSSSLSKGSSRYQSSFTLNDGLPSNNIHQIFCDSRNIVWLATDAGFFEFNGGKITLRKELESLYGERILSVCEDEHKNLWVVADNIGLCRFDGYSIKTYTPQDLQIKNDITSLFFDKKSNKLILGTKSGVYKLSIHSDNRVRLDIFESENSISTSHLLAHNKQLLAVSDRDKEIFEFNFIDNKLNLLKRDEYLPIIEFNNFHTAQLLNDLALKNEAFKIRTQYEDDIECEVIQVVKLTDETFYLLRYFIAGTEYRKVLKVAEQEVKDFSKANNIDDVFVQSIFIDKDESNIWLGTRSKGILHFQNSIFQYYDASYFQLAQLNINDIESDNNGYIYIATKNEIIYFKEDRIQKRISTSKLCAIMHGHSHQECEHKIHIYDILNNNNSELWLATNMGFYTLNLKTDKIRFRGITPANKFIFTKDKQLCCIWNNKFSVYSGPGYQTKTFTYKIPKSQNTNVSKIVSRNSAVWFSTKRMGLFRFESNQMEQFNKENSDIHNIINDFLILPDGNMIAGANNGYIYKLKYKNKKLKTLRILNHELELSGNPIQGFQYLKDGSLWCGTNEGVYRFEYEKWTSDSSLNYRFWDHTKGYFDRSGETSIIDKDQNIWIKTNTQLLKITNSAIDRVEKSNCTIKLKKLQVYNKDWKPNSSKIDVWTKNISGPIALEHDQNYLTFTFNFQNYLNPGKSVFRFQLKGLGNEWSNWSTNNQAVYSNLPSGEYILNIQGKHLNKAEIVPTTLKITIAYPWWEKTWFYAFVTALFIGLVIATMRLYARKIRKEEEDRNKINTSILDLKMKTLQNQLDPHFIFNALNSIQGYILEQETENALDYLSDFSTVLRKNINNADKNYISLSDEIAYLKHYVKLEQMRFMNRFIFEIAISKEINPYNYHIPPMLIQPFIESAIRFGLSACKGDGLILINIELEDSHYIRCSIEDNGIGRTKSKEFDAESRKSYHERTMNIVQERITLLNKINKNALNYDYKIFDLHDETQTAVGTKVEIGLPFLKIEN